MAANTNGIVDVASNYSVDQTVEKAKAALQARGITLFVVVDHSGEAQKVGLEMPPTKLLIFGNPKGGTPAMVASPNSAIDLPLKLLIREDINGRVWVSYNTPEYIAQRHSLPDDLVKSLSIVESLAAAIGA